LRITIAGASGFIGKNLIEKLGPEFKVKGLS
jgi:nucleoside-diphosphate-sugar epimerase